MTRRDDEIVGRVLRLDGNKWSFNNRAPCGQEVFMRPCQTSGEPVDPIAPYPYAAPCRNASEMVIVVDDDEDIRQELIDQVMLLGYPAKGCANGDELLAICGEFASGCILLDIGLPGEDGLALQKLLRSRGNKLPIVFVSGRLGVDEMIEGMKDGAAAFLRKPYSEPALHRAVTAAVGQSRKLYCRLESKRMVTALFNRLSETEQRVAEKIASGYPTKLIAAEMDRSENTIKIHRQRIFMKLRVNSAASVANLWRQYRSLP